MKAWLSYIAFGLAAAILILTIVNASWLASPPRGAIKLIAHRGIYQQFDRSDIDPFETCTAELIEQPVHDYQENTVRSMQGALRMGADMVEVDIAPTTDGQIAVFHDWTLDCRTDGSGEVRDRTMAELKTLDIAHGYTADGGRSYPFRGQRRDSMPTLEEAIRALPATPIMFNFKSKDPAEADLLAARLEAAGRKVEERGDAFYGALGPVERIRQHYPAAWSWSKEEAKGCTRDYILYGWTSIVPESCRNGTMIVPLNMQWMFWGWPNRLLQRMESVGARVIVTGPYGEGQPNAGLMLPEQLGEIPASFKGYVWVEDIWTVGPAFRPNRDMRTAEQQEAAEAGLERRRERMR